MSESLEFSPAILKRLISPSAKRIHMDVITNDPFFKDFFNKKVSATVVIIRCQSSFEVKLERKDDQFIAHLLEPQMNVNKNDNLLVIFTYQKTKYCLQCEVDEIFVNNLVLKSLDPRAKKRIELESNVTVAVPSLELIKSMLSGENIIKRSHSVQFEKKSDISYIVLDRLCSKSSKSEKSPLKDSKSSFTYLSGSIINMSQGGCAIRLGGDSAKVLKGVPIVFLQGTLQWDWYVGLFSSFVAVRKYWRRLDEYILNIMFLKPLEFLPEYVADGCAKKDFFVVGDISSVTIDSLLRFNTKEFSLRLPYGRHHCSLETSDGMRVEQYFDIDTNDRNEKVVLDLNSASEDGVA